MEPGWIAGASAGAVNGAIICGNAPDQRVARLRQIWGCDEGGGTLTPWSSAFETVRRTMSAATTMLCGHPGFFIPRHLFGPWWNPLGNDEPPSLYDLTPLEETLRRSSDFDLLNNGQPRLSITAVDVLSGEDVVFDTSAHRIGPEHVRASASLLPAFPPVAIGDRLLADAGISANLPLDVVLAEKRDRPLLCIAVDLLPLESYKPVTLGETAIRAQDLIFATQSRRALAAWQSIFDAEEERASSVTLLHLAYHDHREEVAGKAFDFSPSSAQRRWRRGYQSMTRMLGGLVEGHVLDTERRGLNIYRLGPDGGVALEAVRPAMQPVLA